MANGGCAHGSHNLAHVEEKCVADPAAHIHVSQRRATRYTSCDTPQEVRVIIVGVAAQDKILNLLAAHPQGAKQQQQLFRCPTLRQQRCAARQQWVLDQI